MPRKRFDELKTISVCITGEQEKELIKIASEKRISISEIIRQYLDQSLFLSRNVTRSDTKIHAA